MPDVAITKAPTRKPSALTLDMDVERGVGGTDVYTFSGAWKVPSAATSDDSKDRWTREYFSWMLYTPADLKKGKYTLCRTLRADEIGDTSDSRSFDVWKLTFGSRKGSYARRADFYPWTSVKVAKVQLDVWGWNNKGDGPACKTNYNFKVPRKPEIDVSFDASSKEATFTITTDPGNDACERHDTRWRAVLSVDGQKDSVARAWGASTSTEITWTYDFTNVVDYANSGKAVAITIDAYARGIAGDSGTAKRKFTVAYPRGAQIKSINVLKGSNLRQQVVDVAIERGGYVSGVQLQRLTDVDASIGKSGTPTGSWTDVDGAEDDGECRNLYDNITDGQSTAGKYTWYRVDASNCGWHVYSKPVRADNLFVPAPVIDANDKVGIISIVPAKSGTSASVTVGWSEDLPNTGTEISWSDRSNAWSSSDPPDVYTEATTGGTGTGGWKKQFTRTISNLVSGTTYYLRARRYLEADGVTTYTKYTETASFRTESAADDTCGIVSATPSKDGTTATIVVGYTEDNPNTGTSLTWSTDNDAWRSNQPPDELRATWSADNPRKSTEWTSTQTIYLRGLEPGATYYIRARRYLEAGGNTTYSPYSKRGSMTMKVDSAANDRCGVISATSEDEGTGLYVIVGWTEDSSNTGTEIQWTDDPAGRYATEQPSSFTFGWSDSASRSTTWKKTAGVHLRGLDPGTKYWLRARRYLEGTSGTTYSPWSALFEATSAVAPKSVQLFSPSIVRRNYDLALSWEYEGEAEQTAWAIHPAGSPKVSLASGKGSTTYATVKGSALKAYDEVGLYVTVSCGALSTDSQTVTVTIADKPAIEVYDVATTVSTGYRLTAQPLGFSVRAKTDTVRLLVTVIAHPTSGGISAEGPAGEIGHLPGETIWTGVIDPAWEDGESETYPYEAAVELPDDLPLIDGELCRLQVVPTDVETGLTGSAKIPMFRTVWAHQAAFSGAGCSVAFDRATRSAQITLAAPSTMTASDTVDLYRQTPTGYELCAADLQPPCIATDRLAPFGESRDLAYRACLRTADGDLDFADLDYEAPVWSMRIDFGSDWVELPYNIGAGLAWAKDFEARAHVDGGVEGYWDAAVRMEGTITTEYLKSDRDTTERLRRLADHAGACFVRTPDGLAFQADVQVQVDDSYATLASSVTLKVSAVALTTEYMLTDDDVQEVTP